MGYEDLANAIILKAVDDYRTALQGVPCKDTDKEIKELEKFFRSAWFKVLTKIDGEYLIARLREEEKERENKNE